MKKPTPSAKPKQSAKFLDKQDVIEQLRTMCRHGGEVMWAVLMRDVADWLEKQKF